MVRTPTIASVQYTPGNAPETQEQINRYMVEELRKISAAINLLALGHLDETHVAPDKPREGDIRLCDGTNWNPLGTGKKFVGYRGGAWLLLG